ncbi:hypothetical protein Sgly_0360 [Syntrophobotulus glycolicus DSM 8271]|uniref:Uncharacterized protein n=1 Tax=Syntrophobotulus glycolicus (strain DSM 8271 / FlGlyR) TaxID=645991 RepID=F0SXI0_SYNGF|nr:hypothetical protein [Syntrophobotulus glycolicus]ADY54726.1 hypothetical protein Sgly_0360 [Syntrophobotulus glycolicus DSM 8271]
MRYEIKVTVNGHGSDVDVEIYEDDDTLILAGHTKIGTTEETTARQYAENIFLPDLRRNFPEISTLELPIDLVPEVIPDEPINEENPEA